MSGHIVPLRLYVFIFAALIVLTGVTTAAAFFDLGRGNTIVALTIAATKMMLVLLYFMHLRYSHGLTRIVVLASFIFLAILIGLTMSDILTRGWTPSPNGWQAPAAALPSAPGNP
jgi:cytochrome c oxidase subunit 4